MKGTLEKVTLSNPDENMGEVRINTITPTMREGSWSGEYYTDYPVTITAVPKEGYEFVGWSGDITSTESEIEIPVNAGGNTQGMEISAAFRKCE